MAVLRNKELVKANIRARIQKKVAQFTEGLKQAGLYIQAKSMEIVPVDYGILKGSAFTRVEGENTSKVRVVVGYTAKYAVYVHENLDAAHGAAFNRKHAAELSAAKAKQKKGISVQGPYRMSRGENQQAKFLEQPFRQAQMDGTIMAIILGQMLQP